MSYYLMHRGWMDKRVFEREPYTRAQAWIWMIENAAFAPADGLLRGQMRASLRFMAKAWGWQEPKVRRWLAAAQNAEMIVCVTDAGRTLITICNYDKYQYPTSVADAPSDAQSTQYRRIADANLKKEEDNKQDLVPIGTRQSARQIAEWMVEVWKEVFGEALTVPTRHNANRIRSAKARFDSDFHSNIAEWKQFLQRIRGSPWLMGGNDRQWQVDFDWVLKPANLTKIFEGRYDRRTNGAGANDLSFYRKPTGPAPKIDPATGTLRLGKSE